MIQHTREEVLRRLHEKLASRRIIVAAGAGTGLSAKAEEEGGADLILVFNSGYYRMHGLGSLSGLMAYGDANAIALEMGERHVLPIIKEVPVLCSVNGTDPTRLMDRWLARVSAAGFSGVNNFPTVGLIDGRFRAELEQTGMSYEKEVAAMALARRMGLFTAAYAFDEGEAGRMARAGCDMLLAHVGLTRGGTIGSRDPLSLEEAALRVGRMKQAAQAENPNILVLCHGGPIATPADVRALLRIAPVHGFVGASSMERLPVEAAIREATASFADIEVP